MRPVNPYDLHQINYNGREIYARPILWNGLMTNQKKQSNAFNELVIATRLTLTCPDCAINIELDISQTYENQYYCECVRTKRSLDIEKSTLDVFKNPFEDELFLDNSLYPIALGGVSTATIVKKNKKAKCKVDKKTKHSSESSTIEESEEEVLKRLANEKFDDSDLTE